MRKHTTHGVHGTSLTNPILTYLAVQSHAYRLHTYKDVIDVVQPYATLMNRIFPIP